MADLRDKYSAYWRTKTPQSIAFFCWGIFCTRKIIKSCVSNRYYTAQNVEQRIYERQLLTSLGTFNASQLSKYILVVLGSGLSRSNGAVHDVSSSLAVIMAAIRLPVFTMILSS